MGVALITPFKEDESVDYDALMRLVDYLLQNNADFLCVLGTTAETPTLSEEEKKKIKKMVTAFDEAKVAVSLFSMGLSDTEIAQGALNGTLKASEVLAGLLTGKISLMTLAQAAAAKAQAAFNAVLAANPITLVVVAIGALVGIWLCCMRRTKISEIL